MDTPDQEELESYESRSNEAIKVMKRKLPEYIVNCFIASGFDTLAIISEMDISSKPGNSLQQIEEYITAEHSEDPGCMRDHIFSGNFKFPPGHRHTIEKFVNEMNELQRKKPCKKRECEDRCILQKKKRKVTTSVTDKEIPNFSKSSECADSGYQARLLGDIRRQVAKWQQSQKEQKLRELKEHTQFEIHVAVKEGGMLFSNIHCNICGKRYSLGKKDGLTMISNWTKHVSKCVKSCKNPSQNLHRYFTLSQTAPHVTSPELSADEESTETHTSLSTPVSLDDSCLSLEDSVIGSQVTRTPPVTNVSSPELVLSDNDECTEVHSSSSSITPMHNLLDDSVQDSVTESQKVANMNALPEVIEEHITATEESTPCKCVPLSEPIQNCKVTEAEDQYFRLPPPS